MPVPTPRGHGHAETIIVNLSADPILEDVDRRGQATEGYFGGWEPSVESGKVRQSPIHSTKAHSLEPLRTVLMF